MSKTKIAFVCSSCGGRQPKWVGRCPDCGDWNTLEETTRAPAEAARHPVFTGAAPAVTTLDQIDVSKLQRFSSSIGEFDRVLGGGFVPGSAVVVGGSPGAGKSTLLLQVLCAAAETRPALYVSGEESLDQIAARARRLGLPTGRLKVLSETNIEGIAEAVMREKPAVVVIDSIQVMQLGHIDSAPGGVTQVRECAAFLTRLGKQTGAVVLMVGHVTKDQSLAGPMTLNHLIDTSIMLSSTDDARYRLMRASKNRFGPVNEIGVFAMTSKGMREVNNPSAIFLARPDEATPGSVVTVLWEGTRPLLVEMQALVDDATGDHPRRLAVGMDHNRLSMLIAVLHRHGGLQVSGKDVFLNVVGGIRIAETGADLTVLLAIGSSLLDRTLPHDLVAFGEVGLAGEIRPIANGQERIVEAAKHGFKTAIVPRANVPKGKIPEMQVIGVSKLSDALRYLGEALNRLT